MTTATKTKMPDEAEQTEPELPDEAALDAEAVTRLLAEYTGKLNRSQTRSLLGRYQILTVVGLVCGGLLIYLVHTLIRADSGLRTGLNLLIFVLAFLAGRFLDQQERLLAASMSRPVLSRFERLVRTASQLREHGRASESQRIELDLRIAEAEALLKRVDASGGRG